MSAPCPSRVQSLHDVLERHHRRREGGRGREGAGQVHHGDPAAAAAFKKRAWSPADPSPHIKRTSTWKSKFSPRSPPARPISNWCRSSRRSTGHKVATTWAGTADIMKRMAAGEVYDLVVSSSTSLDDLIKQRQDRRRQPRSIWPSAGIGIAVEAGAPRPDVSSPDAFKQAVLAAKTVGYSTGPSGVYLAGLFERMGIADAVKPKIRQVPSGGTVGAHRGERRGRDRLPAGERTRACRWHRLHRPAAADVAEHHGVLRPASTPAPRSRLRRRRWWRFSPRPPPEA